jgi:hypothetical protein
MGDVTRILDRVQQGEAIQAGISAIYGAFCLLGCYKVTPGESRSFLAPNDPRFRGGFGSFKSVHRVRGTNAPWCHSFGYERQSGPLPSRSAGNKQCCPKER